MATTNGADEFGGVLSSLREQENELNEQFKEVERKFHAETKEIREKLERVRAGIAGLAGQTVDGTKKTRKKRATSGGNGLSAEEIVAYLSEELKQGGKTEDEIKTLVGEKARAENRSRQGAHFAIGKALKQECFKEVSGKWTLA